MKFKKDVLEFTDIYGETLTAEVVHGGWDEDTGFLFIETGEGRHAVRMTREEARKFAKAIRKEVRKVQA